MALKVVCDIYWERKCPDVFIFRFGKVWLNETEKEPDAE